MNELLKSGTLLQNHYRILRVIDQGGMGAIYMAENRQLFNEVCAIKEMLDNYSSPEERKEGLQLFEQEAKILNTLRHPNLPRVQAYFSENNRYYLVMDYIKGRTLDSIVESTTGFIPESAVLRWCADLCNILEYLHSKQPPIIFRDLNPRNIMLEDGTGDIKLIDFGIARFFKAGKSSDTISLGSPGYSPIEQYGRGQTDVRSDVYTLGATLYHLLTKKVSTPAIERIKPTPALLVPPRQINKKISPHVEQVILQALEINPDDRFQAIGELREALFPTQVPPQTIKTQTVKTKPNVTKKTAPQSKPRKPATQPNKPQTAPASKQQKQTAPATGRTASKRRGSPKFAWFILLFVASMAIAEWVEGWQNRDSGGDETPRRAKSLTVPGSANDRVSFLDGDRTDWWQLKIAQPGTLVVTITPRYKIEGVRLMVFDQTGNTLLQKGIHEDAQIKAVVPLAKPTRILAQVMAPRIWDETGYIINASTGETAGIPLITRTDVENPMGVDEAGTSPMEIPDHPTPETALNLIPDTMIQGQVHITDRQGESWWHIRAPSTGQMSIIVDSESAGYPSPRIEVYDENQQRIEMSKDRADNRLAAVLLDNQYYIKLKVNNHPESVPYTILARFIEDGDIFSGDDGEPAGASEMPFEGSIQDSVSVVHGDQTDWWRLELPATGSIAFDLKADNPDDIRLQVYETDAVQRQNDSEDPVALTETTGNNQVRIDGSAGSTYYVAVSALEKTDAGAYEVQTAFLLDPDANSGPDAEPSGAKPLSANSSSRDTVDFTRGDRTDWWRISTPGAGTLTILLSGRNITTNLQLEVYDADGINLLKESKAADISREEITLTLTDRTTCMVKVFAEAANDASAYQLMTWYAMEPNAKSGDDKVASGAMALRLGQSVDNSVDYNGGDQTDWWKIDIPSTGELSIRLEGEAFISNFNVNVYGNPDSTALASLHMFRKRQEQISIPIKEEGQYYIEIFANDSGDKSRYTLSTLFKEQ